jgi:hypothetical protein
VDGVVKLDVAADGRWMWTSLGMWMRSIPIVAARCPRVSA